MEASTAQEPRRPSRAKPPEIERPDPPETPDGPERDSELIRQSALTDPDKLPKEDAQDALEVFLRAEGEQAEIEPTSLTINLGTLDAPNKVKWVVLPVDDNEITKIREQSKMKGNRAARRRGEGEVDETLVARKIVARATVTPDLVALGKRLGLVDPSDALYAYFKKFGKTGLITQISGEVLSISGWDDEAVQEMEVEAAQG